MNRSSYKFFLLRSILVYQRLSSFYIEVLSSQNRPDGSGMVAVETHGRVSEHTPL